MGAAGHSLEDPLQASVQGGSAPLAKRGEEPRPLSVSVHALIPERFAESSGDPGIRDDGAIIAEPFKKGREAVETGDSQELSSVEQSSVGAWALRRPDFRSVGFRTLVCLTCGQGGVSREHCAREFADINGGRKDTPQIALSPEPL
jgi:hypothetical protein